MNDLIKKGLYLGLGVAFASKEKVEKYVNDLVAKGDIAPSEAKEMIVDLTEKGKGKQDQWSEQFREEIASSLKRFGFVTKEEMESQLAVLEEKIDKLSNKEN